MYLKKLRLSRSLVLRLTLWYGGIFSFSMLTAFVVFYFATATILDHRWDRDALSDIEEYSKFLAEKGRSDLTDELRREAESDGIENVFYRVLTLDGKTVSNSNMTPWKTIGVNPIALSKLRSGKRYFFETLKLPEHEYETHIAYGLLNSSLVLQIGESTEEDTKFLSLMRRIFAPIMMSMALIAMSVGWAMAKRAMGGVERVTETSFRISQGALDKRVNVAGEKDEIARLGMTFNMMLDKINTLIGEIKEMGDSLAHDLKTPLARIRGESEMCLTRDVSPEDYKAMAASTIEECDRLLNIINTMMDISEAESGVLKLESQEIDLVDTINEACELFRAVAEGRGLEIKKDLPSSCLILRDRRKIQRMISNLLDNALKYTPKGGIISLSLKCRV